MKEAVEVAGGLGDPGPGDDEFVGGDVVDAFVADGAELGELAPEGELAGAGFRGGGAAVGVIAHVDDDIGVRGQDLFEGDLGEGSAAGGCGIAAAGGGEEFVDVGAWGCGEHALEGVGGAIDDEKDGDGGAAGGGGAEGVEFGAELRGKAEGGGLGAGEFAGAGDGGEDLGEGIEGEFLDAEAEAAEFVGEADGIGDDEDESGPLGEDAFEVGLGEGADFGFGEGVRGEAAEGGDAGDLRAEAEA